MRVMSAGEQMACDAMEISGNIALCASESDKYPLLVVCAGAVVPGGFGMASFLVHGFFDVPEVQGLQQPCIPSQKAAHGFHLSA
jgi:hypothetical protein